MNKRDNSTQPGSAAPRGEQPQDPWTAGQSTGSWWHHTFNPWWGCTKISPACTNCYAEKVDAGKGPYLAKQSGQPAKRHWGDAAPRLIQGSSYWQKPAAWNRKAEKTQQRLRVFCGSMCDVFEDRPGLEHERTRLFATIQATPWLNWLLLTKRPKNFAKMLPWARSGKPLENVWLGVTAENQKYADQRIPLLLAMPARIHFISYEPALGPLALGPYLEGGRKRKLGWVIGGNEDAARAVARRTDPAWLRGVRDQCAAADVPFHIKQWAGPPGEGITGTPDRSGKIHLPMLDGQTFGTFPSLADKGVSP